MGHRKGEEVAIFIIYSLVTGPLFRPCDPVSPPVVPQYGPMSNQRMLGHTNERSHAKLQRTVNSSILHLRAWCNVGMVQSLSECSHPTGTKRQLDTSLFVCIYIHWYTETFPTFIVICCRLVAVSPNAVNLSNTTIYIVECHLPRGSKLRWREDMGGKLPSVWGLRIV